MPRMNPEIKKRWVEALRSGNYRQGQLFLKDNSNDRYCCLGVLTQLAIDSKGINTHPCDAFDHENEQLPPIEVLEWAQIKEPEENLKDLSDYWRVVPDRPGLPKTCSLAYLNDTGDYSFSKIADIIEEQF